MKVLAYSLLLCAVLGMKCSSGEDGKTTKIPESRAVSAGSDPQAVAPATRIVVERGLKRLIPGEDGWTALMSAALEGDLAKVQDLIAKGADVNARNRFGGTALMLAASQRDTAIVEALLAKGADIDAKQQEGTTALSAAVQARQVAIAQILLSRGADPNAKSLLGSQVLQAAADKGQETIVRALLDKGADVDAKDDFGTTALLSAVRNGHKVVVESLLDKGADPRAKDRRDGQPPLVIAAERGDDAIVRLLLRSGADVNAQGGTYGDTALIRAASRGHTTTARALLDSGADVKANNAHNRTALLAAAEGGSVGVVELLLGRGVDINARGGSGDTALIVAARAGQEAVVRLLLDKGADIDIRNNAGKSALGIAEAAGRTAVVQTLLAKVETAEGKRKEAATLFYFQTNGEKCDLKNWNPTNQSTNVLVSLSQCPGKVFFVEEANALVVVTGSMIQEISVKSGVNLKTPIRLPSTNTVVLAGYLADGRLATVFDKVGPADDSDLSLYAFENKKWDLVTNKHCGRFFTIEGCLQNHVRGRSWNDWGEETQVWHPKLALNPFVASRGVATPKDRQLIPGKREVSENEETWGYVRFSIKNHQSILFHDSRLEQGDFDEGMFTFSIYLQTYKDRSPVAIVEGQTGTAIEHKYLLLSTYGRLRLIDLETGEEPIKGLKFAFWVR